MVVRPSIRPNSRLISEMSLRESVFEPDNYQRKKTQQQTTEVQTELQERHGHTRHEIMKGWWLSGEYMVFLTSNFDSNEGYCYHLELYNYRHLKEVQNTPLDIRQIF